LNTLERIRPALGALADRNAVARDGILCLEVEAREVRALAERLRGACGFQTSTFVTAVDRFPDEPRFEVVWQFHALASGDRVRVRARVAGALPRVPSLVDLYPGAAFSERECFDLFGIEFEGHPGLKRLLMPDGYDHFPLRKDFPHQGIEPDRLYREWDRARRERPFNRDLPAPQGS
jgi:NADH-quinone oxidoreductase subunit C